MFNQKIPGVPTLNPVQNQIVDHWIKNSGQAWSMFTPKEQLQKAMAWDNMQKISRSNANVAPQADVAKAPSNIEVTGGGDGGGGGGGGVTGDAVTVSVPSV